MFYFPQWTDYYSIIHKYWKRPIYVEQWDITQEFSFSDFAGKIMDCIFVQVPYLSNWKKYTGTAGYPFGPDSGKLETSFFKHKFSDVSFSL